MVCALCLATGTSAFAQTDADKKGEGEKKEQAGPPPTMVVLEAARLEKLERKREVTGRLDAWRRSLAASEQEGLVQSVAFEVGDAVNAGATLVQLDDTLAKLAVSRAEAVLAAARQIAEERDAEVQRAQRDLTRTQTATSGGGMSESDLDMRRTAVATWQAKLAQARADIDTAEVNVRDARRRLEKMTVKSPFKGRVVRKITEVGQWVHAGDAVAEVVDTASLDARLDVPGPLAMGLKPEESKVRVSFPALGVESLAVVYRIVPDADPLSRLVPVRVRVENKDGGLLPGMSITGLIPLAESEEVLTVSKDAVLRDDAGTYVYFDAGGKAIPARVRVRFSEGDRAVLEPGAIAPGMNVLVEGNERIFFPGQPIAPVATRNKAAGANADPTAQGNAPYTISPDAKPADAKPADPKPAPAAKPGETPASTPASKPEAAPKQADPKATGAKPADPKR